MNGQQTLIARGVVSIFAGILSVLTYSHPRLLALPARRFDRLLPAVFFLSRIGVFALVFLALRIPPRGDVQGAYWPEANSALHGLLPYRDFPSSYAPLHPYLDAAAIRLWHSPLALILLAILAESLLLPLWLRLGRTFLSEQETRNASILYLCSVVSLQFVTIDGQSTVIISVLLALSLLLILRNRFLLSGAVTGLSITAIKILPLLFVPVFFLSLPRRWRWTAGVVIPVLLVYTACAALHLPVLVPLQREGNIRGAGNLPFLIESIFGVSFSPRLWDLLLFAVLASISLLAAKVARQVSPEFRLRVLTFAPAALTLAFLLFSKKSWPPYLMLSLLPICALPRGRRQVIGFALTGLAAAVEHSYWATIAWHVSSQAEHLGLLSGQPGSFIFLVLEAALLAGYLWLLLLAVKNILMVTESSSSGLLPDSFWKRYLQGAEVPLFVQRQASRNPLFFKELR